MDQIKGAIVKLTYEIRHGFYPELRRKSSHEEIVCAFLEKLSECGNDEHERNQANRNDKL
ncbi:hypothetical protein N7539_001037 [Penicillium diatomitis]|uniref:Uncharacterized protein n=1 Tax=Penicillium diatomitis TaxID=2819901 RepID=A0A9W9XMU7_9EURO|nr:uncharacterized protein N7539_001037 [Penicillium diatomitis]KAJ5495921.1 hypothetical protein N7539_001037 [Penicillium diatomitis]